MAKPDNCASLAKKRGFGSWEDYEAFLERRKKILESADKRDVLADLKERRAARGYFKKR